MNLKNYLSQFVFLKLAKDKFCLELISLIFPQFININILNKISNNNKKLDFIILISLLTINSSDNVQYFLFKFNISKNDKKRILFLNDFFSKPINKKTFTKDNLWKIFYYNGKELLIDLLNYQIIKSKKDEKKLLAIINFFQDKAAPKLPINANYLINEFNMNEGKELGLKLKKIEEKWVNNNFKISDKEIKNLAIS